MVQVSRVLLIVVIFGFLTFLPTTDCFARGPRHQDPGPGDDNGGVGGDGTHSGCWRACNGIHIWDPNTGDFISEYTCEPATTQGQYLTTCTIYNNGSECYLWGATCVIREA